MDFTVIFTHTYECVISRQSRFRFTGIGPDAESNPATLRIKYGINPGKSGICPIPAAESKVGYIPLEFIAVGIGRTRT